ncbi:MAG: hypothetical protein KDI90_09780 [Alphaproteobacteria bacterium]|nr:hypothetical protein [Alphaproteobacteria bacterium]MCB9974748.1 hypothetical protein [Rhodospirillales bacterium]
MSSIRDALERLDLAIGRLEDTADSAFDESALDGAGAGIDPDFLVARIDRAIACVETLLSEGA